MAHISRRCLTGVSHEDYLVHRLKGRPRPRRVIPRLHDLSKSIVEPGRAKALEPVAGQISADGHLPAGGDRRGRTILLAGTNAVLRAFQQPFDEVWCSLFGHGPLPHAGACRWVRGADVTSAAGQPTL